MADLEMVVGGPCRGCDGYIRCPFFGSDENGSWCGAAVYMNGGQRSTSTDMMGDEPPWWCPLKHYVVTVRAGGK